jgi:hypothetical protein
MRTLLTIDDDRPMTGRRFTTSDGLLVTVTCGADLLGEGGYAGSPIYGIDQLCSGLLDESFEDAAVLPRTPETEDEHLISLPHSRRYARGMSPPRPAISRTKLGYLLSRKHRASIPMSRVAEMASLIERAHPATQHEEVLLQGFIEVTVSVEHRHKTVVRRTLWGVPACMCGKGILDGFVADAITEARDLICGGINEHR